MAATYLDDIVAAHRAAAAQDGRDLDELVRRAATAGPVRGFANSLRRRAAAGRLGVVAEVKRRSPSKGALNPDLDPATVAGWYATGGAAAVSVLTDEQFFGGCAADLQAARGAVALPVLRKDFTVAPADVADARLMGADAVLLIVAALSGRELADLVALSRRLGLDALVEIHDERELAVALEVGATIIGVNQRDLTTFEVDPERAARVGRSIPGDALAIAESGIGGADQAKVVADAGFDAVLVGESLVCSPDPVAATATLAALDACGVPGRRGRSALGRSGRSALGRSGRGALGRSGRGGVEHGGDDVGGSANGQATSIRTENGELSR